MTDDKIQPNVNDRHEQTKPERVGQQAHLSPIDTGVQPGQRVAPGRRPLFRR